MVLIMISIALTRCQSALKDQRETFQKRGFPSAIIGNAADAGKAIPEPANSNTANTLNAGKSVDAGNDIQRDTTINDLEESLKKVRFSDEQQVPSPSNVSYFRIVNT
jgi:hypothetical protein